MGRNHADQLTFRESVVKLVKVGRWATIAGETRPALARRLGVTVDVLNQADRELADEAKQRGIPPRQLGNRAGYKRDYATLGLTMPPQVHVPWLRFCKSFRKRPATMLRSLIHHFLVTKSAPRTLGGRWLLHGEYYSIKPGDRLHARARVTRGAQIALDHYATIWNVKATGIIRGLIAETLERGALPRGMTFVTCTAMWGDATKYLEAAP